MASSSSFRRSVISGRHVARTSAPRRQRDRPDVGSSSGVSEVIHSVIVRAITHPRGRCFPDPAHRYKARCPSRRGQHHVQISHPRMGQGQIYRHVAQWRALACNRKADYQRWAISWRTWAVWDWSYPGPSEASRRTRCRSWSRGCCRSRRCRSSWCGRSRSGRRGCRSSSCGRRGGSCGSRGSSSRGCRGSSRSWCRNNSRIGGGELRRVAVRICRGRGHALGGSDLRNHLGEGCITVPIRRH